MKHLRSLALAALSIQTIAACSPTTPLQELTVGSEAVPPQTVTFIIKNYNPQAGNSYANLFVSNFSVKVKNGQLKLSSSRDGLADDFKAMLAPDYGFTTSAPESTVNGFADLLLYQLGIKSSQQNLMYCASNLLLSSSNDAFVYNDNRLSGSPQQLLGLRDCEKVYLGLQPAKFDTAGNGIPDYMKMRCGINLLSKNSAYISSAGDGMSDLEKCKRNIPIDENAYSQPNKLFAYQYSTKTNTDGSVDLTIANIPILNDGLQNFVAFYMTEVDNGTSAPSIYTAYAVLKAGSNGKTIEIPYWATSSSYFFNQEITTP